MRHRFSLPAPASPLAFWRAVHARPTDGFFLGSGVPTPGHDVIHLSLSEPTDIRCASANGVKSLLHGLFRSPDAGDNFPRFVGLLAFDAGRGFDAAIARLPRQPDPLAIPAARFGDYPAVARINLATRRMDIMVRGSRAVASKIQAEVRAALSTSERENKSLSIRREVVRVASLPRFRSMVAAAKTRIGAGDIYQANLSLRFERRFRADPRDFYADLCRRNPSPYAALVKAGGDWIVSCSPELLVSTQGRRVVTRPIAGTRPRGRSGAHDRRTSGRLLLSPKERAEHIMLVDLERNDLGRVCKTGSVKVTEQMAIERYSHVMHIVSQVEGRLAAGRSAADVIASTFPGGTITGCPKIRSIEIIQGIEREARSVFYGSAGYVAANGDAKLNILIRTALIRKGRLHLRAGAGIVADSNAGREYREVFAKARAVLESAERVS